jgi:hypothetical protein
VNYVEIGKELSITKRNAFGRAARTADAQPGLSDPYIRLTERPERASRWRDGQRKKEDDQSRPAA